MACRSRGRAMWWQRMVVVWLVASWWAEALSRGFGKIANQPKKKAKTVKKKQLSPGVHHQEERPVDHWGLPEDFGEDEVDARIAARCAGLDTPTLIREMDPPSNIIFGECPEAWLDRVKALHADPLVLHIQGLLTPHECDELIKLTKSSRCKEMPREAGTFDASASVRRTSTTFYARYTEPEAAPLVARASAILGVDWSRFEELQIARYYSGERFKWHEDAVPPSLLRPGDGGQRLATLLVYLSGTGDIADGGTTTFRDLQLSIVPKKGDAALFFPAVADARGSFLPDDRTLHAADPVLGPNPKWVSQLWLHESDYPPTIFKNDNPRPKRHADLLFPKFSQPPPLF